MERFNKKIYTGSPLTFFYLALIAMLNLLPFSSATAEDSGFENVSMKKFISPKYNEKTHKLEYIMTGSDAQTIGAFIKITNARIEMVDKNGKTITSVITTPEAFFNRATEIIRGDKPIHYQSLAMTIDGIGFDSNMKTQLFHIRKNVEMLITSTNSPEDQKDVSPVLPGNNKAVQAETEETKIKTN